MTRWYPDQEAEADYHPVRVTSSRHYTVIHSRSSFLPISKMTKSKDPLHEKCESLRDTSN